MDSRRDCESFTRSKGLVMKRTSSIPDWSGSVAVAHPVRGNVITSSLAMARSYINAALDKLEAAEKAANEARERVLAGEAT